MCILSVNTYFYEMCTDGRIRLFWGVSPDVMALALLQDKCDLALHLFPGTPRQQIQS